MFINMKTELKKGILDSMTTWQNLTGSPRQSFSAEEKEADSNFKWTERNFAKTLAQFQDCQGWSQLLMCSTVNIRL